MKPDATGGAEHAHTDSKQAQAEGVHLGIGELGAVCGAAEHIHEDVGGGVQEQAKTGWPRSGDSSGGRP